MKEIYKMLMYVLFFIIICFPFYEWSLKTISLGVILGFFSGLLNSLR